VGKKVAVTGASGHIGANLVRELLGRGYEVVALVRNSHLALDGLDIERVHGDILDVQSLRRAFKGAEHVYHLAALISILPGNREKLERVNVQGTQNVIQACLEEGVETLVHFSSIHALDQEPLDQPVTEDNALAREHSVHVADYDRSKAAADRLVREMDGASLSTRIIYPTAVFGPNDFKLSLFGQVLGKLARGELPALVAGGFDWVDARDVAWGAVEAAERGANGDRFMLSGHYRGMPEVAAVVAALSGVRAPRFTCPLWLAGLFAPLMTGWARVAGETPLYTRDSLAALKANKVMSHERASRELAYSPRPFRESRADTLNFYYNQKQYDK